MLKANELRNMTVDEITQKMEAFKKELYQLRTEAKAGRIEKPHRISQARKDIAKCETILKEKANAKQ
ncbi:MAG: 50S ribosomal protein L29 [Candidatus Omnitrophica bacterium]|mgnify:CR=1 FL=1|nr:50S ribosomal protein L29 [Candidatus Omnitrophota bacterium]HPM43223.1 50S ribosomal protein L29 [Candidatus Omnitrophota bacterium]